MSVLVKEMLPYLSPISDAISAIVGVCLLFVAIYGLNQIKEARNSRVNQAKRDSLEYSDKIVDYYLEKIHQTNLKLDTLNNELGIKPKLLKDFTHPKQIFQDAYTKNELDSFKADFEKAKTHGDNYAKQYLDTKIELCNRLEKICFMINTNLSYESIVSECIGNALMSIITLNSDMIKFLRIASIERVGTGEFKFIERVYTEWYAKLSKDRNIKVITNIEKEILELKNKIDFVRTTHDIPGVASSKTDNPIGTA